MKILIDLTSLSYHISGIERYALCISEEMVKQDLKNEYLLVFRNEIFASFIDLIDGNRVKATVLYGNNKLLFREITLAGYVNSTDADVKLFLAFTSPFFVKKNGVINTIHDVGIWDFPNALDFLHRMYFRIGCMKSVSVSDVILTVSEFSKSRICDVFKIDNKKVQVAYSAPSEKVVSQSNSFEYVKEKYHLPSKYIMSLSTMEPRKNQRLLFQSFSDVADSVDYDLVLVGRVGWNINEIISSYSANKRIHITGFVDDEDVACIYKNAMCFVFPSLYEGFGLPPIEALSLGTAVISSDAASMPEILRKQATFFKSNDEDALEKLLLNLEDNLANMPHELDEFQKGQYRFDVSAGKILDLLERK
ncbi:glycosyltransferase family 4 protein [Blautia sp. HCP3S3_H10_1]|uniref:glycosyltransferase family 4 protein n=1 Tax=unclassified Blautia TaxID=2648079 RepID=UPI003F900A8D